MFFLNTNRTNRTNLCTRFASAVGSAECMRGTIASEASDIVFKFLSKFSLIYNLRLLRSWGNIK